MNIPDPRRLGRRGVGPAMVDQSDPAADPEQLRLSATVTRLRLELARLRGELDDAAGATSPPAAGAAGAGAEVEAELELTGRAADRLRAQLAGSEAALAEEREARIMLETLRDGLQAAMEEQRRLYEREVTDVQEAAEERHTALARRLEAESDARARAEARGRELDREVDELRNWVSAVESRGRSLFRRHPAPPPSRRIPPPNVESDDG